MMRTIPSSQDWAVYFSAHGMLIDVKFCKWWLKYSVYILFGYEIMLLVWCKNGSSYITEIAKQDSKQFRSYKCQGELFMQLKYISLQLSLWVLYCYNFTDCSIRVFWSFSILRIISPSVRILELIAMKTCHAAQLVKLEKEWSPDS